MILLLGGKVLLLLIGGMGAAGEGLRPFSRFSRFTGRGLQMLGINIYYPRYCYGCRKKMIDTDVVGG